MAVEFALLAFPFFLLMMVLIETSTIFYAELVMDRAVAKVGREVRTGQITTAGLDAAEFKQKLCDEVDFLFDCAKLHVDLKTYNSFGLVPTNVPVKDGDLDTTGFGFGDMVIMELLMDKGLVPDLASGNEDIVIALSEDLRPAAMSVAARLRASGRSVDLVLEDKRMKWAFRHAERSGAQRMVMVMPDEWAAGNVRIKELESGEESDVAVDDL